MAWRGETAATPVERRPLRVSGAHNGHSLGGTPAGDSAATCGQTRAIQKAVPRPIRRRLGHDLRDSLLLPPFVSRYPWMFLVMQYSPHVSRDKTAFCPTSPLGVGTQVFRNHLQLRFRGFRGEYMHPHVLRLLHVTGLTPRSAVVTARGLVHITLQQV